MLAPIMMNPKKRAAIAGCFKAGNENKVVAGLVPSSDYSAWFPQLTSSWRYFGFDPSSVLSINLCVLLIIKESWFSQVRITTAL